MSEELVTLASFFSPVEAHMVRSLLAEEGIESVIFNEQIAGVHMALAAATGGVRIKVLASDYETAMRIMNREQDEGADDGSEAEWDDGEAAADYGADYGEADSDEA